MFQVKWLCLLAIAFMLENADLAWSAEKAAGIEIGIAPFLPVKTLVQNYAPMLIYLEQRLKEPVTMVTAPDYQRFNERIGQHEYPLIITGANSAYLAWAESGYVPLLRPIIYTRPVMVVAKNQKLAHVRDLRGKKVAMSDALAVVSMQGMQMLREAGLVPGRDVTVMNMPNHGAAVNHVISGEVSAAIVSDRALNQLPSATRNKVKITQVWEQGAMPGIVYMGSPDLPRERLEHLSRVILEYARDVPEGVELMRGLGYGGLAPFGPDEIRNFTRYGEMLKESMYKAP